MDRRVQLELGNGEGSQGFAGSVLFNALWGGLAGAAVGAGVGLIRGEDFGQTVTLGAGIGIVAGAIWGTVVSLADEAPGGPPPDSRSWTARPEDDGLRHGGVPLPALGFTKAGRF